MRPHQLKPQLTCPALDERFLQRRRHPLRRGRRFAWPRCALGAAALGLHPGRSGAGASASAAALCRASRPGGRHGGCLTQQQPQQAHGCLIPFVQSFSSKCLFIDHFGRCSGHATQQPAGEHLRCTISGAATSAVQVTCLRTRGAEIRPPAGPCPSPAPCGDFWASAAWSRGKRPSSCSSASANSSAHSFVFQPTCSKPQHSDMRGLPAVSALQLTCSRHSSENMLHVHRVV